jgi:penicillin-insensitive murein DD-endopeptidase
MVRLTLFLFYLLLGSAVVAEPVAKELFSTQSIQSSQRPAAWGSYAKGCLAGAEQLAETGATWQAMRLGRNRNWGHPELIEFIERLSQKAARFKGWNGLYVGDLAQPRGGPMGGGHRSHQTGLDVDIWMRPASDLTLSPATRENLSSISMRRAKGAYTNDSWSPQHMQLLKAAAQDPAVARIFLFPGAKVQMCNEARGNRDWLRKIRPWWGHYAHFHVRLNCPDGARGCVEQAPPPPGDGCAEAQTWVDNILNPPPPPPTDPNEPKPQKRQPLLLTDLPAQCTKVISSR